VYLEVTSSLMCVPAHWVVSCSHEEEAQAVVTMGLGSQLGLGVKRERNKYLMHL
jgi:hypothetical protein